MKNTHAHSPGFTIVELLISTAVFSFILVAVSVTVVEISRLYYKGTILTRTQDTTRNLIENVARPIQLEGADIVGANGGVSVTKTWANGQVFTAYSVCIGTARYTYTLNKQVRQDPMSNPDDYVRHAAWQDSVTSPGECSVSNIPDLTEETPTSNGRDALSERMRLTQLEVYSIDGSKLYGVNVTIMYGDRDLMRPTNDLTADPTGCASEIAGSQWCAIVNYETTVMKRISGSI